MFRSIFGKVQNFTSEHPCVSVVMAIGAVPALAPGLLVGPALGAAGFTMNGIAAGSTAAAAHSGIGSVVAPSLFATLQSAGAAGYGLAAVNGVVHGVGAVLSASGAAWSFFGGNQDQDNQEPCAEKDGEGGNA